MIRAVTRSEGVTDWIQPLQTGFAGSTRLPTDNSWATSTIRKENNMKPTSHIFGTGFTQLLTSIVLGMIFIPAMAQDTMKPMDKTSKTQKSKTVTMVKYKAHCGMFYSVADAKKYHYICPMDHKKLTKIVVKKSDTTDTTDKMKM